MSGEAASSKKNMSGKAGSSKENLSTKTALSKKKLSAKAASSKKTMFAPATSSSSILFLDELQEGRFSSEQALELLISTWPTKGNLGQTLRVTLRGGLGDILIEKKTNGMELAKEVMLVDYSESKAGTLENLLMWVRNRQNESVTFTCQVRIDNIRTKKGGTTHRVVARSAINEFRLELKVSDETTHVVVVMFDETSSEFVKCSEDSIVDSLDDDLSLPPTLTNIHSAKTAEESASSSTVDAITNPHTTLGKRFCKYPSVLTPLKLSKEKKSKRDDLKDSDAELSPSPTEGVHDDKAGDHFDRKKKNRLVHAAHFSHLEEDKARRRGQEFNWNTATYGKVSDALTSEPKILSDSENEFPSIVYNDALTSEPEISSEPTSCRHSDASTTHILARKRNMEDHTEQIPGTFSF
ncbi:hypothetical protein Tco_0331284 [Tanacetum coccineum]